MTKRANGSKKNRLTAERRRQVVAKLLKRDGPLCFWCREDFNDDWPPTIDHIVPITEGGDNMQENLVLACSWCNQKRGTKTPDQFIAWLAQHHTPRKNRRVRKLH